MIPTVYLDKVRGLLDHLGQTQLPAIERAAELMAAALTNRGVIYCSGLGHGIQGDFINRAGGLAAIQQFSYNLNVAAPVPRCHQDRPRPEPREQDLENVRFAVQSSNLRAGDVMLVASVSGRNREPIELALACRARGLRVIGFTALAYSRTAASLHPSQQRLDEAVDVVIDLGVPAGDAAVAIPGYAIELLPLSGVAIAVAGWMIFGRVLELMAERGRPATVYSSINRAGGDARYRQASEEYNQRGY
jgi:uncharacterized phosphosugar-binding protein